MLHHTRATSATLKSRAIKNIESFLDKDAQAIPQHLVMGVIGLLRDNSPLVRADAVSLVSKCLEGNPALEKHCLNNILSLTVDPSNGPKKKAINLLKKLYQSSSSSDHKLNIMASLLLPSQDHEKIIADLSRQALEDIWFKAADTKADDNKTKLQRIERAWLFVQLVRNIKGQVIKLEAFEKFFVAVLAGQALNVEANLRICKDLVADMVEGVISPDSMPVGCTQEHVLQSLSIFARIHPGLFSIDQLQLLEFYVKDPTTIDDLNILRPTATIFRFVLPRLPNLQADFGDKMFTPLTKVIPRVASWAAKGNADGKDTLQDVIHCQWVICPFVTNGIQRMIRLVRSIVTQLQPLASSTQEEMARSKNKIISFLIIIGTVGKVCNFDNHHADMFCKMMTEMGVNVMLDSERTSEKGPKGDLKSAAPSVIMLETVRLFTKQPWELSVRNHALCSVGEICQGSPSLFMRTPVEATFKLVFKNDVESLKRIALSQFHDFFVRAERRSDSDTLGSASQDVAEGTGPLGITFVAGDNQVTTNWLARRFLQEVVDVALKMEEELALIATIIITSVSRQGLVHPKECGAALIALGTSPNTQIAQSAAIEHKKIHDAHESIFEKEYMAATRMAFEYQREVYKDPHGMVASTFKPKMLHVFNVLKGGNRKTLKKFIDNFCKQMNFDLPKLADPEIGATTLLYTRFCLENLALFDVPKLEDVAIMTNALENIVMKLTGPLVGVAIDTEVPKAVVPGPQFEDYPPAELGAETIAPALGNGEAEERLLQLTRACTILQMMWETRGFIRKAYNLHNTTGRILHKDYQKPAQRNNFVSGKELRERLESVYSTDDSREAMVKRCLEFAELLEIDKDAQFGEQDGEDEDGGYVTPDEAADAAPTIPTSGRGRKRKSSASISNTPKKQRGRPPGTKNKKRNSKTPDLGGWD
jgi:cohesin loading factor subunit SCC2